MTIFGLHTSNSHTCTLTRARSCNEAMLCKDRTESEQVSRSQDHFQTVSQSQDHSYRPFQTVRLLSQSKSGSFLSPFPNSQVVKSVKVRIIPIVLFKQSGGLVSQSQDHSYRPFQTVSRSQDHSYRPFPSEVYLEQVLKSSVAWPWVKVFPPGVITGFSKTVQDVTWLLMPLVPGFPLLRRVISLNTKNNLHPYSPQLFPFHSSFWAQAMTNLCRRQPSTLHELKIIVNDFAANKY